mgnify:FL=1
MHLVPPFGKRRAGFQIVWAGRHDGGGTLEQCAFKKTIDPVGGPQTPIRHFRRNIRLPMHDPRQSAGARTQQRSQAGGIGHVQVQQLWFPRDQEAAQLQGEGRANRCEQHIAKAANPIHCHAVARFLGTAPLSCRLVNQNAHRPALLHKPFGQILQIPFHAATLRSVVLADMQDTHGSLSVFPGFGRALRLCGLGLACAQALQLVIEDGQLLGQAPNLAFLARTVYVQLEQAQQNQ